MLSHLTSFIFCLMLLCTEGHSQEKIILGQSAAFSGSSRSLGIELWRGAEAYFREANAQKLLGPYQIEVEAMDDYYEGNQTLLNTIELVKKNKVFCLFGYVGTPTIVRALPAIQKLYRDESVFLFSNYTGAGPQRHYPYEEFVFNIRASYEEETLGLVEKLIANGHKRIGLFIQSDAYGRSGAHGVMSALTKYDLQVAHESSYERGAKYTQSMKKQVKDLIEAKVDAIISISSYEASAAFIRDARLAGLQVPIANVSFVGADQLLDILKGLEQEHKINLTDGLINTQVVPPWSDTSIPVVAEYQRLVSKYAPILPPPYLIGSKHYPALGSELGFTSLEGFINAKLLVALLKEYLQVSHGKLNRDGFRDFVKQHKSIDIGLDYPLGPLGRGNQFSHHIYFTEIDREKKSYKIIKDWTLFQNPRSHIKEGP